ncbi:MAG: hypothetical protein CMJ29_09090 [Phycisphaerae bacterium]|nr:hypothetical protein [Phycisphaerae bacterium]
MPWGTHGAPVETTTGGLRMGINLSTSMICPSGIERPDGFGSPYSHDHGTATEWQSVGVPMVATMRPVGKTGTRITHE